MADLVITLTVPEAKISIAKEGYFKLYPNVETKDDPEWVDPEDGSEPDQIPAYTDLEWFKEHLRRMVVRDVRRGLQVLANEEVVVAADDEMVS